MSLLIATAGLRPEVVLKLLLPQRNYADNCLRLGTHYPCSRAVDTAAFTGVQNDTLVGPVITTREHG